MSGSVPQALGVSTTTAAASAAVLPNTGATTLLTVALAVAVFLITWGALIARSNR